MYKNSLVWDSHRPVLINDDMGFILILHRYDRFTDAFEHVSTVIDDIYKVSWLGMRVLTSWTNS